MQLCYEISSQLVQQDMTCHTGRPRKSSVWPKLSTKKNLHRHWGRAGFKNAMGAGVPSRTKWATPPLDLYATPAISTGWILMTENANKNVCDINFIIQPFSGWVFFRSSATCCLPQNLAWGAATKESASTFTARIDWYRLSSLSNKMSLPFKLPCRDYRNMKRARTHRIQKSDSLLASDMTHKATSPNSGRCVAAKVRHQWHLTPQVINC